MIITGDIEKLVYCLSKKNILIDLGYLHEGQMAFCHFLDIFTAKSHN